MNQSPQGVHLRASQIRPNGRWKNNRAGWSVVWLMKGQATCECTCPLPAIEAGAVIVLPQGIECQLKPQPGGSLLVHALCFDPGHLPCSIPLGTRMLLEGVGREEARPAFLPKGNALGPLLGALAEEIRSKKAEPRASGFFHTCPCPLAQRLSKVLEELKNVMVSARGTAGDAARRLAEILGNLPETELPTITLDDLARRCGYSRRHLARLVREQCGQSLAEIVVGTRLNRAADLLRDPNRKVADVAMDCGFNHLGAFSARFRQRFGLPPTLWRRQADTASAPLNGTSASPKLNGVVHRPR